MSSNILSLMWHDYVSDSTLICFLIVCVHRSEGINFNNAEDNFLSFMKYLHSHDVIYARKISFENIHETVRESALKMFPQEDEKMFSPSLRDVAKDYRSSL